MEHSLNINAAITGFGLLVLLFLRLQSKNYAESELKFNLRMLQTKLHVLGAASQIPSQHLLDTFEALIESWQRGVEARGRLMNLVLFDALNRMSDVRPRSVFSLEYEQFLNDATDENVKREICQLRDELDAAIFSYLWKTSLLLVFAILIATIVLVIQETWQRQWNDWQMKWDKVAYNLRIIFAEVRRRFFKRTIEQADYEVEICAGAISTNMPAR